MVNCPNCGMSKKCDSCDGNGEECVFCLTKIVHCDKCNGDFMGSDCPHCKDREYD